MYKSVSNFLAYVPENIAIDLLSFYIDNVVVKNQSFIDQFWVRPVSLIVLSATTLVQLAEITGRVVFSIIFFIPYLITLRPNPSVSEGAFKWNYEVQFGTAVINNLEHMIKIPTIIAYKFLIEGIPSEKAEENI
jgi:hypothetical protein